MSEFLYVVRKVWAREHDPATRAAFEALETARRAHTTAPSKATRKALASAERAYCAAVRAVPIQRGAVWL